MARELITAEASPIMRATKLADLANRFANTKCGRPRMQLDQAVVRDPSEQGLPNNYGLIWTGGILLRIRRLGFESLRPRHQTYRSGPYFPRWPRT